MADRPQRRRGASPRRHRILPELLLTCILQGTCAFSGAQTPKSPVPSPGCGSGASVPPCPPPKPAPSTASQFPYPGDSASADDPAATPGKATPPQQPANSSAFPYPGDPDPAPAPSSSSSGSSSSSADPDLPPDPPSDTEPTGRRKLPKITRLQSDDEREAEDVKVAKFYHDDGNDLGSYQRLKDAVSLLQDDPDAWFLLGEVAGKLKRPTEALEAYNKFLALEPDTRRARQARRDLAALPPRTSPDTPVTPRSAADPPRQ